MARHSEKRLHRNPADDLTDDLIVEILSRLPVKSVCRFKCVSWYWRGLIAHPDHRRKLPQTLSGFFCSNEVTPPDGDGTVSNPYIVSDIDGNDDGCGDGTMSSPFLVWDTEDEDNCDYDYYYVDVETNISIPDFASILPAEEEQSPVVPDPSLSFLPGYKSIAPKHCCSGHLLCFYWEVSPPTTTEPQYVVCNPATQQWRTFPRGHRRSTSDHPPPLYLCLDDDPATSSHFHAVALINNRDNYISGVDIYSSEAGAWSHNDNGWGDEIMVLDPGVLLDGMLHLIAFGDSIIAVDRDGKTWNSIPLLEDIYDAEFCSWPTIDPFIGKSQGRLLYMNNKPDDHFAISVWILEDYYSGGGGRWVSIFKYNINTPEVFGPGVPEKEKVYNLVAVHPDCNLIFFTVGYQRKLMSYNMDRGEFRVVGIMKSCTRGRRVDPYIPYVPSFSRAIC